MFEAGVPVVVAEATRLMTRLAPRLLVGVGLGAVIAAGVASPRVVEAALFSRAAELGESKEVAPVWHGLYLVIIDSPLTFRKSRMDTLQIAVPEVPKSDSRGILIVWRRRMYPQKDFGRAFAVAVGASEVDQTWWC